MVQKLEKENEFTESLIKEDNKNYIYYNNNGQVTDLKTLKLKSVKLPICAYSFTTPEDKNKYMVLENNKNLFDPNYFSDISYNKRNWKYKAVSESIFKLYISYLNPKKRSAHKLLNAERALC